MNIRNPFLTLVALTGSPLGSVHAADLGYRYRDGSCVNAAGAKGLNPSYVGQCSQLSGVTISRFSFDEIDLSGSEIKSSDLQKSTFKKSILVGVSFESSNLAGVDFAEAVIEKSSFVKANLKNVSFAEAKISAANFDESDFVGLDLSYLAVKNSSFRQANFTKSVLESTDFSGSDLSGALLSEVDFENARLDNVKLNGANLRAARLQGSSLKNADLTGADLRGAKLTGIALSGVKLEKAQFNRNTEMTLSLDEALKLGMIFQRRLEFAGIARDLKVTDLEGWKMCHQSLYSAQVEGIDAIVAGCKSSYAMLACRAKGSDTLKLAAYGSFANVFKEIGTANTGTLDNGVLFYFSNSYSMGFAPAGAALNRNSCDFMGDQAEMRLCFHTSGNNLSQGYRCGDGDLNSSDDYERLIFSSDD